MAAFHSRFKKNQNADTPPQSPNTAMDSKAQQAAMLKKKFDSFHARYQNSPPSSETSPQRDSSSTSLKADAVDSLPLIEKKSSMASDPRSSQTTHSVQYSPGPPALDTSSRQNTGSKSFKTPKPQKVKKPDKADADAIKAQFAAIHSRYQNSSSHPDATPFRRSSNSTSSLKSTNSDGTHQPTQAAASNLNRTALQNAAEGKPLDRSPQRARPPELNSIDGGAAADDRSKHRLSNMFTRSKPPKPTKSLEPLITPLEEEEDRLVASSQMPRSNGAAMPNAAVKRDIPIRPAGPYEPPPLFQAYPQAVKHTTLPAPIVSADLILQERKNKRIGQNGGFEDDPSRKGASTGRGMQALYEDTDGDHWTRHEYVLVTSGYLLQYSSDGPHDRLPEKTLQLGRNSAAFASDALPGKYYVLQVTTDAQDESLPNNNNNNNNKQQQSSSTNSSTKSMFKKMGFRSEGTKRAASNFLLVFGTPEEMEAWIIAVRKEIENMGGRAYRPDSQGEAVIRGGGGGGSGAGKENGVGGGGSGGNLLRYNTITKSPVTSP